MMTLSLYLDNLNSLFTEYNNEAKLKKKKKKKKNKKKKKKNKPELSKGRNKSFIFFRWIN